ncbi:MAG TPA: alpha-glucan family phosphorylase, partial [Gemmatimonadaceae bacterium]|nr:alpha-glucan family phosphorylase [Gemmatimonadaceae bacterium]
VDRSKIPYLPERIEGLGEVATNLSWSWSRNARALFAMLDDPLWHLTRHNPIAMLRRVAPDRLSDVARDPQFLDLYDRVMADFRRDQSFENTWFTNTYPDSTSGPVAYFCAEFGLHNSVPIYSGGLGVLAGDHCKSSSDLGIPLVGIGLFYTKGYFDQKLRIDGWQEDSDEQFDVANTPLERVRLPGKEPWLTKVNTFGREIHLAAWRMNVGRVPVYLLDSNLEENDPADRELTSKLYTGGPDVRLRQEWILGVGGVRVLRALGIAPAAWHANEGHAAFMLVERLREFMLEGASFEDGVAKVRAASVFTTHTPVPAGHDTFSHEQVAECAGPLYHEMGIDRFLSIGQHPTEEDGRFHMTVCALRLSRYVNGVARRHGEVSRQIWAPLWPDRDVTKVPIGHVTNGVHKATWMSKEMMELFDHYFGHDWGNRVEDPALWESVLEIDDVRLWHTHLDLKTELMNFVREQARRRWARHWKEAAHVVGAGTLLNSNVLTIGFARRFATYKRADLIFSDIDRLRTLLVDNTRPVQIIFAGKAHPADTPGKEVLRTVYGFTRDPKLEGRVAFIEDYDLHLAHRLVQGVDLWLNLPRVPLEASGTSGMKAALNGVPQLSTLDGWWHEGYDGLNGWAIPPAASRATPDEWDADRFYTLLEEQVIPLYYTRDERGVPHGWLQKMKHAIRVAGQQFTSRRMLQNYARQYYTPAMRGETQGDDPPIG